MIKSSTAISKWLLIIFSTAIVIFIFSFIFFRYLWTIQKTPTCISYHFETNHEEKTKLINNLKLLSKYKLEEESPYKIRWISNMSELSLSFSKANMRQKADLYICEPRNEFATLTQLAQIAVLVQKQIPDSISKIVIKTQLNAMAYDIPKIGKYYQLNDRMEFKYPLNSKELVSADISCKNQLNNQIAEKNKKFECVYP